MSKVPFEAFREYCSNNVFGGCSHSDHTDIEHKVEKDTLVLKSMGKCSPKICPKLKEWNTSMNADLSKYIKDVTDFDEKFNLEGTTKANVGNLAFAALAFSGEAGELSNVVKKIWRDGESEELIDHLEEEVVDAVIYLIKIIKITGMDFDDAWDKKHNELHQKWKANPDKYRHGYSPVDEAITELQLKKHVKTRKGYIYDR